MPESHRPGACLAGKPGSGRDRPRRGTRGAPRRTAGSGRRRMDGCEQGGRCCRRPTGGAPQGPLISHRPRSAAGSGSVCRCSVGRLADGGIPYRVRGCLLVAPQASTGLGRGSGLGCEGCGSGDLARVSAVATGDQSGPQHPALGEPACGGCLKLKEINHLQHTTGAAHYSALPWSVGPHFLAGFP